MRIKRVLFLAFNMEEVMVVKFWTIKDGAVGTAHHNRDGKVVDFRPGIVSGTTVVTICPSKGVLIYHLKFNGTEVKREFLKEEFYGARFLVTVKYVAFDQELFHTYEKFIPNNSAKYDEKAAWEINVKFGLVSKAMNLLTPEMLVDFIKPRKKQWGRLLRNSWYNMLSEFYEAFKAHLLKMSSEELQKFIDANHDNSLTKTSVNNPRFREQMIEIWEAERVRIKEEWLKGKQHASLHCNA